MSFYIKCRGHPQENLKNKNKNRNKNKNIKGQITAKQHIFTMLKKAIKLSCQSKNLRYNLQNKRRIEHINMYNYVHHMICYILKYVKQDYINTIRIIFY